MARSWFGVHVAAAVCAVSLAASGEAQTPRFDGAILAAADADMAATAYADGRLEPLGSGEGADALVLITHAEDGLRERDRAPASNSVVSWPHIIAAGRDGRTVYVVEARGPAPAGADRVDSAYDAFPDGRRLQAYRVENGEITPIGDTPAGLNPQSVSLSPDGRWLVAASEDPDAEAVFVPLDPTGRPGAPLMINLDPPYREGGESRLRGLAWSPAADLIAANVENERLAIYRVERDRNGRPAAMALAGPAIEIGGRWTVADWTPDGRTLLLADTGWGSGRGLNMLFNGPGRLISIRVDADASARVVDELRTGLSPEGFAISPDGRLAAVVNMGRTYLHDAWFLRLWPQRDRASVQLVAIDPATGALSRRGEPVPVEGLLPEDAVFDADGDAIAVAVFHERSGPGRRRGFVDVYPIVAAPDGPRLQRRIARAETMRGPHDLIRLDPSP